MSERKKERKTFSIVKKKEGWTSEKEEMKPNSACIYVLCGYTTRGEEEEEEEEE